MRVLNWVQTWLHGAHCSKKRSESSAGSARLADTSSGLPRNDELHDGWTTGMLSIGTLGTSEGRRPKSCDGSDGSNTVGVDELKKLQEELAVLMRPKGVKCASSSKKGGGVARQRSFMKLVTSAFSGFMPRPSFRETMPESRVNEILGALLHKNRHPDNSALSETVIKNDRTVQMPPKGTAGGEEEGAKWIRTDSEYIVLEI